MTFFLGLVCYLAAAATLVSAGLLGLAVPLSPPTMPERVAGLSSAEPPVAASQPGEQRLSDTAPTDLEFRHGPKIDHAQGAPAVRYSRQALEEARSAMAREQARPPRKRLRERDRQEIVSGEAPAMRFEYPPERPSGH